jgi:hypothetical protein
MSHRQNGPLGTPPCRQPMVLGLQVTPLGVYYTLGCLHQNKAQPGVAFARGPAPAFAPTLIIPWTHLGPRGQVGCRRKPGHIYPDLG